MSWISCAHPYRLQVLLHLRPQGAGPVAHNADVDADKLVTGGAGDGEGVPLRCGNGRHIDERVLAWPASHVWALTPVGAKMVLCAMFLHTDSFS